MAAASRALKDFNKQLSDEALATAISAWQKQHKESQTEDRRWRMWFFENAECIAALQLYITTNDKQYEQKFNELIWPLLDSAAVRNISIAAQAVPYMSPEFKSRLEKYVLRYRDGLEKLSTVNPYGVPIGTRGWAGNSELISWSITNYYLHRDFPTIIGSEDVFKGLDYVFGCHPYSNISFVAGVGTHSKRRTYGSNRADFSFIAGGVVPGVLLLKPDFLENKRTGLSSGVRMSVLSIFAPITYFWQMQSTIS